MITPLNKHVLVKPLKGPTHSKGGITLPESEQEKGKGQLIAMGSEVEGIPNVALGQDVYFNTHGVLAKMSYGEFDVYVLESRDLLAFNLPDEVK